MSPVPLLWLLFSFFYYLCGIRFDSIPLHSSSSFNTLRRALRSLFNECVDVCKDLLASSSYRVVAHSVVIAVPSHACPPLYRGTRLQVEGIKSPEKLVQDPTINSDDATVLEVNGSQDPALEGSKGPPVG